MNHKTKEAARANLNGMLLLLLTQFFSTPTLSVSFHAGSLSMKDFLHCLHDVTAVSVVEIVAGLREKSQRRASEQFTVRLSVNRDQALQEIVTEQVQQVLHEL